MIIFHHFNVQTLEHSRTQTYKPQPETSADIRKPIGGDKRISSSLDHSSLRRQIVQIVQLPTQICSSSVLRCCFLSSDRSSILCRQIVPLFVVRLFLCSSSSDRWFFFNSIVVQVPKSSLRDSVLPFRTRILKSRDLCGIFCPTHPAQRTKTRVFETRVLI